MFYLYILLLKNGNLYKGTTSDIKRRIKEHRSKKVSSTKSKQPLKLIHCEIYSLKSDAQRREKFLKTTEGRRLLRQQLKNVLKKYSILGSPGHSTGRPVE
ncbi:hypothetical protein AMJ49_06105 [Parcubacteria bacterium DG_74_2]|nr:MAG: hypothetical protein AMJ49_06105 [Parcubacteria bacterium DG_74_2]